MIRQEHQVFVRSVDILRESAVPAGTEIIVVHALGIVPGLTGYTGMARDEGEYGNPVALFEGATGTGVLNES